MNKITLALLVLASFAATARSQEQAPQLLIRAAHCLAVKHFFPRSKVAQITFGYLIDEKSYPGTKVMYVVTYAAPARSNGSVFAIVLTQQDDRQIFNIQNNADFVLSKRDVHGVDFITPPLGGDWTQERLASAVEHIEKRPTFTIPGRDFVVADASTSCESYTDPQPKRTLKRRAIL
ncbi:MAG: hypothetical protein ACREBW_00980 [Candidatus Micrarchaeaceae archaeon]